MGNAVLALAFPLAQEQHKDEAATAPHGLSNLQTLPEVAVFGGSGSPGQSPPGSQGQVQAASLPVTWGVQSAAHLPGIRAHPALILPFFCLLPPRFLDCSLAAFVHLVT